MTDLYTLMAAIFSALATGLAAFATWRAPKAAAKLADELRREGERNQERQKNKLHVFATLMQERAAIYSENGVRALNLVDVVFNDTREVRDAWAELFRIFSVNPIPHLDLEERLNRLLVAMAKDIGLADQLRPDDIGRVYYPNAVAQDQLIRDMQRQHMLTAFSQTQTSPATNIEASQKTPWPPKPT
jgi:hypothetical protein